MTIDERPPGRGDLGTGRRYRRGARPARPPLAIAGGMIGPRNPGDLARRAGQQLFVAPGHRPASAPGQAVP
ncbi:hypothetical protein [Amycolatopsis deserti]|nr:hypothetical protein [Amycolatopsis deserti]